MGEALALVGTWSPRPARVVVISDGAPNEPSAALAAARLLKPAVISALFIGAETDRAGIGFMHALSLMGARGGRAGHRALAAPGATRALAAEITLLLAGPAR